MDAQLDGEVLVLDAAYAIEPAREAPLFELGGDERRMHVRAYNYWVSLLKERPYPSVVDLDPATVADFGANGVLLDFAGGGGVDDPAIAYLGPKLADECGLGGPIARVAEVPSRSLLSRLTDHYLQILANCAPVGFEAEFVNARGRTTLYRGILMPFSGADGSSIDFMYGVINWKELADPATQEGLNAELAAAMLAAPASATAPALPTAAPLSPACPAEVPIWADGPGADAAAEPAPFAPGSLADSLMIARETAAAVRAADTRSRSALYRALGRAHDFALAADAEPEAYQALVAEAGITIQPRAPLTPVVKLVFGVDYDKTRLTEFATVLAHARRHGIAEGRLPPFLEGFEGGIKAIVAAERQARRPAAAPPTVATALAERPVLARLPLAIEALEGEAVVLVARMGADGVLDIVGSVTDQGLAARVMRAG